MTKPQSPGREALYLSGQNESATLRQHVIAWLAHLDAQGYSPRSLEGYRERLRGLLYAPQVSLEALEAYQRHLRGYRKADGQPLTVGGQLSRLSAIRNFWRWLLKRHVILYNPADLLELPKGESRL
ncbi:recombinase XerD, partial [Salmonella enterica]|nr:recombinase XerD [Salmonella enterica]